MPDRCGHVRRDRLTFELCQAEDGFEEFASSILAPKWKNSHLYFTFSYSCCAAGDADCALWLAAGTDRSGIAWKLH